MNLQQLEKVLPLCGNSLKHFRCLTMGGLKQMVADTIFFKLLMETSPNLQILDIQSMKLSSEGLQFAANHYNNFTDLRICIESDVTLNDAIVKLFASTKRLSALTLQCLDVIPYCLEKVPAETLESMHFSSLDARSLENIAKTIENCSKLHTLRVDCPVLDHSILDAICKNNRQKNFKILSMTGLQYGNVDNAYLIATFTNLQSLTLDIEDSVSDRMLRSIGNDCELLSSFTLYGNERGQKRITDRGLMKFTNIRHLNLTFVNTVIGGCFKRMTKLESVELYRCEDIKNHGLQVLFKSAKNLRFLELQDKEPKNYVDYIKAVPKTRANKVPLKISLLFYRSGEDSCVYRAGYLSVEECYLE